MGDEVVPLSAQEADKFLSPLDAFRTVVLAVSGGPDSMALMQLVAERQQNKKDLANRKNLANRIFVVTVDHALRPASAEEASFVADRASQLGFEHRTLKWIGEKPTSGRADAARNARYRLLEAEAIRLDEDAARYEPEANQPEAESIRPDTVNVCLVTAHTLDDQAETFLMRLKRGSGVDGLRAMAPCKRLNDGSPVLHVRPLLDVPKARLLATLRSRELSWVDDPTNVCSDYERTFLRATLARLQHDGVSAHALATSARRLRAAREVVDFALDQFVGTLGLSSNDEIFARLSRQAFEQGPRLLRERLLAHLLDRFGGSSPAPRLAEVEALTDRLSASDRVTATLGGAVISATRLSLKVWREAGRIPPAPLTLDRLGVWDVWDNRFCVRSYLSGADIHVRALGEAMRREKIAAHLVPGHALPAAAVAALPSFWQGETLLAVPALNAYMQSEGPSGAAHGLITTGLEVRAHHKHGLHVLNFSTLHS